MAESRYTLYQFPMSYYTHKVLLALFEKGVEFESVFVDLLANEQLQDWYYKLHPDGRVPLFQDGDTVIPESEDIIDYLEKTHPEPNLVPAADTEVGKDVARWRSKLNTEVPIELITYGVFYNPQLSVAGIRSPVQLSKEVLDARSVEAQQILKDLGEKNPDFKPAIDRKSEEIEKRKQTVGKPEAVQSEIDELQKVFDSIEQALQLSGAWLCGKSYTVADVTLTVLLNRMILLGLDSLYLTDERPKLAEYTKKVQTRQNTIKMKEFTMKSMQEHMAMMKKS